MNYDLLLVHRHEFFLALTIKKKYVSLCKDTYRKK